jgi:C4-dicarboxylate-specific signal transduction histidine kinase
VNVENVRQLYDMYRELQAYVQWTDQDRLRVHRARSAVESAMPALIDDFYEEIQRHPNAAAVITGGQPQIQRLKQTLVHWIEGLFSGAYDEEFVRTRWRVGRRHVEIGLDQAYATAALARLRDGLIATLQANWTGSPIELALTERTLNKLLDLDVAIIEMAYQQHFLWKLEEHIARQNQQTERLVAIGQMVAGLAHESRNLLQRSHACLEALRLDIDDRPDALKQAARIQSALDQLHRLYEEVRNYAAPIRLEMGEFDLIQLIRQSWQNLDGRWRDREVNFELRFDEARSHFVKADSQRLDQVFTNIFQNALEACSGAVSVVCEVTISPNDKNWQITIHDNGPGIPGDFVGRVFEPFFTTKTQGTGLGMAICQRIMDSHGGTISAGSGPQGGAEIKMELPASLSVASLTNT